MAELAPRIDRRLDRLPRFDEESRKYDILSVAPTRELISKKWLVQRFLNQGREGACVGFGVTHGLLAEPKIGNSKKYTAKWAREQIYYPAQKNDPWPGGEYPGASPVAGGTSLLDGLKQAKLLGEISSYRWSFSLEELLIGVGYFGPAIIGINWYDGMSEPGKEGKMSATGQITGGHCTLIYGVNVQREVVLIHNSWGKSWAKGGTAELSFSDMAKLLSEDGESAFIVKP